MINLWLSLPIFLVLTSSPLAQEQQKPDFNPAVLAKKATPAVVYIKGVTTDGSEVGGSGFIVEHSGVIVTNLHVIQNLKEVAVRLTNGDIYDQVTVRAFDERKDLAVIKVTGFDLPTVELGNSNTVQQGDSIVLVGNPLGLEGSVSAGIISGIRKSEDGFQVFQTDAAANPGNSGGPMLNASGAAIGVLTFKLRGTENLNFVVPINYARGLISGQESVSLEELRARLGKTADLFNERSAPFPQRWKSLTSGTERILRLEGEHVYVEVILPDQWKEKGEFSMADLKKMGDKYVGIFRGRFICQYRDTWSPNLIDNLCVEDRTIEITTFTATRIEGWVEGYPKDDKVNCRKCTHSKQAIRDPFVWIPK